MKPWMILTFIAVMFGTLAVDMVKTSMQNQLDQMELVLLDGGETLK